MIKLLNFYILSTNRVSGMFLSGSKSKPSSQDQTSWGRNLLPSELKKFHALSFRMSSVTVRIRRRKEVL